MSHNHQEMVDCSYCRAQQPFTVWDSVNVWVDPKLKQSLLNGDLTTFRCQHCGHEAHVAYDCLYHDMDRSLAIWLKYPEPDGSFNIDRAAKAMFSTLGENYTCRIVASFHELLDKIRVFDDGFCDHAIELLKVMICIRERIDLCCPIHYVGVESSWFKRKLLAFALQTKEGFIERRYPMQSYLDAVKLLMPRILSIINNTSDDWQHVNRTMMLHVLEVSGLMRAIKPEESINDTIQVHTLGRRPEFHDPEELDEGCLLGQRRTKSKPGESAKTSQRIRHNSIETYRRAICTSFTKSSTVNGRGASSQGRYWSD